MRPDPLYVNDSISHNNVWTTQIHTPTYISANMPADVMQPTSHGRDHNLLMNIPRLGTSSFASRCSEPMPQPPLVHKQRDVPRAGDPLRPGSLALTLSCDAVLPYVHTACLFLMWDCCVLLPRRHLYGRVRVRAVQANCFLQAWSCVSTSAAMRLKCAVWPAALTSKQSTW